MVVCDLCTFFPVFISMLFCAHLNLFSYFLDYQILASGTKSIFTAIAEHSNITLIKSTYLDRWSALWPEKSMAEAAYIIVLPPDPCSFCWSIGKLRQVFSTREAGRLCRPWDCWSILGAHSAERSSQSLLNDDGGFDSRHQVLLSA